MSHKRSIQYRPSVNVGARVSSATLVIKADGLNELRIRAVKGAFKNGYCPNLKSLIRERNTDK
jgi:hypothetical protein